jgi:hypothetical protein
MKPRPSWRKSSYSNSSSNCVEVGQDGSRIAVRDTRNRRGPALAFSQQDWREFTRRIRSGQAGRLPAAA